MCWQDSQVIWRPNMFGTCSTDRKWVLFRELGEVLDASLNNSVYCCHFDCVLYLWTRKSKDVSSKQRQHLLGLLGLVLANEATDISYTVDCTQNWWEMVMCFTKKCRGKPNTFSFFMKSSTFLNFLENFYKVLIGGVRSNSLPPLFPVEENKMGV